MRVKSIQTLTRSRIMNPYLVKTGCTIKEHYIRGSTSLDGLKKRELAKLVNLSTSTCLFLPSLKLLYFWIVFCMWRYFWRITSLLTNEELTYTPSYTPFVTWRLRRWVTCSSLVKWPGISGKILVDCGVWIFRILIPIWIRLVGFHSYV